MFHATEVGGRSQEASAQILLAGMIGNGAVQVSGILRSGGLVVR